METKNLIVLFFILFIGFSKQSGIAQDVKLETTSLEIIDKKLEITYNFKKSKKSHRFTVWVEINNSKGEKINARAFSGDVGENLTGGESKKIIWDYNADGIVLNEEVEIEVFASISTAQGAVSTGKALAKSLVLPGWGLSYANKGKPYWIMGIVGYASLGGAILMNSSSDKSYDDYLNSYDNGESESLLNKSLSQQSTAKILGYTAIGTWTASIIWTYIKATKKNKSLTAFNKKGQLNFFSNIDPLSKSTLFTLQYKF